MNDDSDTETGDTTLAFSIAAIERLEDPAAVFDDAETWSRTIGLIDDDPDRIEELVSEYDLRQDFDMQSRDWWYALDEIYNSSQTSRYVYVGTSHKEMRVSTMFHWEYVDVVEAAEKADWAVSEAPAAQGRIARLLTFVRDLIPA